MIIIIGTSGGLGAEIDRYLCQTMGTQAIISYAGRKALNITSTNDLMGRFDRLAIPGEPMHIIIATGFSKSSMIHKEDIADTMRHFDVNVLGPMLVLKHARAALKANGGSITILSSVVGRRPTLGTAAYAASKAALAGLVKVAALEMGKFARVNVIELGYFDKGMIAKVPEEMLNTIIAEIPSGRLGTGEEVGHAVKFCIENTYLNGAILPLTGGL